MLNSAPSCDKTVLVAAYAATRAEIVERLKMREDLVRLYLIAGLTFSGGSFTAESEASRYYLSLVVPLLSLPVAIMVAQYRTAVEALARFLRFELGDLANELGVPTWDAYTKKNKTNEEKKTRSTNFGNFFGVHFLTIFSVLLSWYRAAFEFLVEDRFILPSLVIASWCAVTAMCVTCYSQRSRPEHQVEFERHLRAKLAEKFQVRIGNFNRRRSETKRYH